MNKKHLILLNLSALFLSFVPMSGNAQITVEFINKVDKKEITLKKIDLYTLDSQYLQDENLLNKLFTSKPPSHAKWMASSPKTPDLIGGYEFIYKYYLKGNPNLQQTRCLLPSLPSDTAVLILDFSDSDNKTSCSWE